MTLQFDQKKWDYLVSSSYTCKLRLFGQSKNSEHLFNPKVKHSLAFDGLKPLCLYCKLLLQFQYSVQQCIAKLRLCQAMCLLLSCTQMEINWFYFYRNNRLGTIAFTAVFLKSPIKYTQKCLISLSNFSGDVLPTNERQIVFKNGTLVLKNISPFDNGNYTCSVHQGNWVAKQEVSVHVRGNLHNFFFALKLI